MKELVCIVCPNGCTLKVDENTLEVVGNICVRGKEFAIAELTNPTRTITTTVKTAFKEIPVLPVRVSAEIPKNRIFDVMNEINKVTVTKIVGLGDIIIGNVLGLNVDVIATSNKLKSLKTGGNNE